MNKTNRILTSILLTSSFLASTAGAQFTDGQDADLVLGQVDFETAASEVGSDKMSSPYGISIHPDSGQFYVSDGDNSRVLRFPAELTSSMDASGVIGQENLTSMEAGSSDSKLNFSSGNFVDADGNLWVADYYNDRILMFRDVDSLADGSAADLVLGQADFGSSTFNIRPGMSPKPSPNDSNFGDDGLEGIFVDSTGRLWVADYDFERVLWFDDAANLANGAPADGVLGKSSFTSKLSGSTATLMAGPSGVFVDKDDNLWVSDYSNNRVLRFDNASTLTSGAAASAVLGQPDLTSNNEDGPTKSRMYGPNRITVDSMGTLWVVSYSANRVIGHYNAASKANGAPADVVLGQANYTDKDSGTAADKLSDPAEIIVDHQGRLLIADYYNSRIVRYSHPAAQPNARVSFRGKTKGSKKINSTGKRQKLKVKLAEDTKSLKLKFKITNDSLANPDGFKIKGSKHKRKTFKVKYLYNGEDVTEQIVAGTFILKNINPEETAKIIAKITTKDTRELNRKIKLTVSSTIDENLTDVVKAQIIR